MNFRKLFRKIISTKSPTDFPSAFLPVYYMLEGVGDDTDLAVVVGDFAGRDYSSLKNVFANVRVFDIVDNGVIPPKDLLLQDASKATDLISESVNYIVMCNVLEHMYGDMDCLVEMNRILKTNGRLFIDTPHFSDSPDVHYRMFSPLIIRRMLEKAGFKVVSSSYRGFVVNISNNIVAVLILILYPFYGSDAVKKANKIFLQLHKLLSKSRFANRRSIHFGEYLLCVKTGVPQDELQVQRNTFAK